MVTVSHLAAWSSASYETRSYGYLYKCFPERMCLDSASLNTIMKVTSVSSFYLIISFASARTIPVAHSIPINIQKLYNAVKHGGCQNYIDNNHSLSDGEGNTGETSDFTRWWYLLTHQIGHAGFGFCTDYYKDQGFIYLAGPGELGDMDVDWWVLDIFLISVGWLFAWKWWTGQLWGRRWLSNRYSFRFNTVK